MALPATDTFTTDTDQALTAYSASWTNNHSVFGVLAASDDVYPDEYGNEIMAHWNADAFDAAQYAQVVCNEVRESTAIGIAVRCHASAQTGYGWYSDNGSSYLWKESAAEWTQIGANAAVWVATHTYRLEVVGTSPSNSLTCKKDGVTVIGPTTDGSAINSGSAGLSGYNHDPAARVDNWEGGNLVVPGESVTDAFTTGSDQDLATYSTSWTKTSTRSCQVLAASDDLCCQDATDDGSMYYWNADSFPDDQYAQATCSALYDAPCGIGPAVRCAHAAFSGYAYLGEGIVYSQAVKIVAGVWTQLGDDDAAWSVSSVYRITAIGTTLSFTKDGIQSIGDQTDAALSTGSAGVYGHNAYTSIRIDNWEGGVPLVPGKGTLTLTGYAPTVTRTTHPSYHDNTTTTAANRTSMVASKPSNTVDGDLLIARLFMVNIDVTITPPDGWNLACTYSIDGSEGIGEDIRNVVYWKIASGEGSTWTWTWGGSSIWCSMHVLAYTTNGTVALDGTAAQEWELTDNDTTPDSVGVTVSTANSLVFAAVWNYYGDVLTPPTNYTERTETSEQETCDRQVNAGATGALVWSALPSASAWCTQVMAFGPVTTTTRTPGKGALTLSGYAPVVTTPFVITPGVGTLTCTAYAVGVSRDAVVNKGALALTGYAPTLTEAQYARPITDVADGTWLPSTPAEDLYDMVDEWTPSDTDYIYSDTTPEYDTAVLSLSAMSTPNEGDVTLRVRARVSG